MPDKNWLYKVFVGENGTDSFEIQEQDLQNLDIEKIGDNLYHLIYNQKSYQVELLDQDLTTKQIKLAVNGTQYKLKLHDKLDALIEDLGLDRSSSVQLRDIYAPMPGLVLSVLVKVGDEVEDGDPLLVLEAMKMENLIKSPGKARVKSIEIADGDSVDKGQLLITFGS